VVLAEQETLLGQTAQMQVTTQLAPAVVLAVQQLSLAGVLL
jgi:hypothetical protein